MVPVEQQDIVPLDRQVPYPQDIVPLEPWEARDTE